jgi:hypothetical protein
MELWNKYWSIYLIIVSSRDVQTAEATPHLDNSIQKWRAQLHRLRGERNRKEFTPQLSLQDQRRSWDLAGAGRSQISDSSSPKDSPVVSSCECRVLRIFKRRYPHLPERPTHLPALRRLTHVPWSNYKMDEQTEAQALQTVPSSHQNRHTEAIGGHGWAGNEDR